jgi:hypothetical protein
VCGDSSNGWGKGEVKVEKCHFCAAINKTKASVLRFWRNEAAHQKSIITSKVDFNIQHYAAQKAVGGRGGESNEREREREKISDVLKIV